MEEIIVFTRHFSEVIEIYPFPNDFSIETKLKINNKQLSTTGQKATIEKDAPIIRGIKIQIYRVLQASFLNIIEL